MRLVNKMRLGKIFFVVFVVFGAVSFAYATDLVGSAFVNVTSDTAATAKNMAMDEARRQILNETLSPYSDSVSLRTAIANEKSSVLTNLIASSSITGERLSDTTYSAKITMSVNKNAAKDWMNTNEIQNWIPMDDVSGDVFSAVLVLGDRVADWVALRRAAANANIDLDTVAIKDGQVVFSVPRGRRGTLTLAVRDAGFQYADRDGVLYVFK